jgi:MFS family permease
MRRQLIIVSAIVLVDTAFYAAITPLLPELREDLGLSKTAAGILTGAYAAGTLAGSLPAAWFAARIGPRPAVLAGMGLVSAASLVFGFSHDIVVLDIARFVQGFGGAASWAGGLTWLIESAPPDRRGELIGVALGAAVAGAILGPVIGAAATLTSTGLVFSSVCVLCGALAFASLSLPVPGKAPPMPLRAVARRMRTGTVLAACALMALPSLYSGLFNTLLPLRLDELGAGAITIGAAFLLSAAVEAALAPVAGRLSDRHGRLLLMRGGLIGLAVTGVLLPIPDLLGVTLVLVVLVGVTAGWVFAPAIALVTDAAEATGLEQAYAMGLTNLTWAAGTAIGAGGGGALADATTDLTPFAVTAGVVLIGLAFLRREPMAATAN